MKKSFLLLISLLVIITSFNSCYRNISADIKMELISKDSFSESIEKELSANFNNEQTKQICIVFNSLDECTTSKYNVLELGKKMSAISIKDMDLSGEYGYSLILPDSIHVKLYGNPLFRVELLYDNKLIDVDYINNSIDIVGNTGEDNIG